VEANCRESGRRRSRVGTVGSRGGGGAEEEEEEEQEEEEQEEEEEEEEEQEEEEEEDDCLSTLSLPSPQGEGVKVASFFDPLPALPARGKE
jgi:DNA-directed RNA polymerase specialized sigma24 family protein